jgi:hypothetical protein
MAAASEARYGIAALLRFGIIIMRTASLKIIGAAAATGLLLVFTMTADAQTKKSACAAQAEAACKANTSCSWIKATKTKKGTTRRAYCRAKPVSKKK